MPLGNETSHTMDGLTVRGGLQVGADGPFFAPNTIVEGLGNWRSPGFETMHRSLCLTSQAAVSQTIRFGFFTAPFNYNSTQCEFGTGSTAAGATPTLVRYGLYLVDAGTQALTLVASTTNDTTLLAAINTRYPKAWTTPYTVVGGARYAVGYLVVTGAALPTLPGNQSVLGGVQNSRPYFAATCGSQADLPLTLADSAISTSTLSAYAYIS